MRSFALCVLVLVACSKDDGTGRGETGGELTRDKLVAIWKKGGLEVSAMTAANVAAGKDCQTGVVNNVAEVLVCQYATVEEANAAVQKGYDWAGAATAISQAAGKLLVAAVDRRKAEPSGKTINQIQKLSK